MSLVGEDEASALADRLQEACDRYAALALESDRAGELLLESKAGLRHLVLSYQELQGWMDDMEARLARYRVLAVHVDKILEQMNDLAVSISCYN
jgi:dystonin